MQYWNIIKNKTLLIAFISSLSIFKTFAQENSPYSRYGLGNLKLIENTANRGMGGVSIADDNYLITNPTNPASFASLKLTSFQVGIEGINTNVKNSSVSNRTGSLALSYVNLGFPLTKNIGVSFGLMPQTRAKYGMQQLSNIQGISDVEYNYYGGGGVQKLYVGGAYKYKSYSLGFSTGYTFGNVVHSSEANFTDSLKILSSSFTSRTNVGGIFLQVGALMNQKLSEGKDNKHNYQITLGSSYSLSQKLNAKRDAYSTSFIGDIGSPKFEYKVDSIKDLKGKVNLPGKLGLGLMFSDGDYWKIGIDFISSDWKNYRSYDEADSTANNYMIKLGGAIVPDANANGQTWKHVTYRAGLYTGKDIFKFGNTQLPVSGVTAGIGYPIRRTNLSIGQINVALDIGKRGTTKNDLLSEGYTRFSIGFTFNDKWFVKRK
jgi:hypothetical protein